MKKWLDKSWAKVVAFCLLLVFTALAAAGGAAIAWLISEDAYRDGGELHGYETTCFGDLYETSMYLHQISWETLVTQYTGLEGTTPVSEEFNIDSWKSEIEAYFSRRTCALSLYDMEGNLVVGSGETAGKYETELLLYEGSDAYLNGRPSYRLVSVLPADFVFVNQKTLEGMLLQWRYPLFGVEAVLLALWIFFLAFSLASAGHWRGFEGIHLTWFDRIPVDLWLAAVVLLGMGWEVRYNWDFWNFSVFPLEWCFLALCVPLLFLVLIAFAAQCKAGAVLKSSLIARLLRLLGRFFRWVGYVLRSIPLVWKTAAVVLGVLVLDVICLSNGHDEEYLVVLFAVNVLIGLFLIYLAAGLRKLQQGGRSLAEGNYESPVETKPLFGDFRRSGEDLNAAGAGLQRAVEQQLRSERMKTELITNVSHDIKTPLTSIVNYVDLLKKCEIEDPTAREYIDVLDRQSQRLRKLTEDLVEASKAASGAVPVALTDTDVNVFLSQAVGEYRERLDACRVEPVLTLAESQPHIRADGKLLWRVLDNLLSNVCKYAMPGTRVYLASETVGDQVLLTVKNVSRYPLNISADELTERFVRGDQSRSTEGSGLGLSIASGLTKLQQGEFRLSVDGDLFKAQLVFPRSES